MKEKTQVDKLQVYTYHTRKEMGDEAEKMAAAAIRQALCEKTELHIVFAAAPSQNDFLESLCNDGTIAWNRINAYHMDEYVGLANGQKGSFSAFLANAIFNRVPFKSVHYINGAASDMQAECIRYTAILEKQPIDFVFMGVGENGHIAFNDPDVANFDDPETVKIVKLDLVCRMQQVHDLCFANLDAVPEQAYTLTIPTLMSAEVVFCMVPGNTKAEAVHQLLDGDISTRCPASILRTHPNATLFLDEESAAHIFFNK